MKILIYGLNYSPELTGIGKYTGEMANWLAQRGHDVRVITAPPYYPEWRVRTGFSGSIWRVTSDAGVRVWRCPLWVPERPSGLKRVVHLLSFAISSFPVMLRQMFWRPDLIWTVEPAFAGMPAALLLGRLSGAETWLHVQDFEIDAAFATGLLNGAVARRWLLWVESSLMRQFSRVSTISGRMLELAKGKGVCASKLYLLPNWVDLSRITPQFSSSYRSQLGLSEEKIVALYSGNMGNKQGLEILGEAAKALAEDDSIQFVFCGEGSGRKLLEAQCAELPNVRFLPLQPLDRLSDLLALADVHLLPQRQDAADLVMPSKLTGMLASERCVLATAAPGTELWEVIEGAAKCGLTVPPGDLHGFIDAIRMLAANRELRVRLGTAGRKYAVDRLHLDSVLADFERRIETLMKRS